MSTIAIDFDGVLVPAAYNGPGEPITAEPLPGAIGAVRQIMAGHAVFVFTARPDHANVAAWLTSHGLPAGYIRPGAPHPHVWDTPGVILVTSKKLPALAYIDDRGIRFTGWDQALADLAAVTG